MIFRNVKGVRSFDIQVGKRVIKSNNGTFETKDEEFIKYLEGRTDFIILDKLPAPKTKIIRGAKPTKELEEGEQND